MSDYKRTASSSALDTTWIKSKVIDALENNLQLAPLATPGDLPSNSGSTLKWILDANTTGGTEVNALTNSGGTEVVYSTNRDSVNEAAYAPTAVSAQMETYGIFVPVRRKDMKQMPKGQMTNLGKRVEYRMRKLIDTLLRATVDGTGTGYFPSMGSGTTNTRKSIGDGTNDTTLSATDYLTAEDVALVTGLDLESTDAEPFSNGMYAGIFHSVSATHLRTDVSTARITWEGINKFVSGLNGQEKILKGTMGAITGTMCMRSNNITTSTVDTRSAYNNIILAQDGVGNASMGDMGPDVFINESGKESMSDPHRLFATVAGQAELAPALLDVNRAAVLYSTAT